MQTGGTALYWTVHYGNADLVKDLLAKGADPNITSKVRL